MFLCCTGGHAARAQARAATQPALVSQENLRKELSNVNTILLRTCDARVIPIAWSVLGMNPEVWVFDEEEAKATQNGRALRVTSLVDRIKPLCQSLQDKIGVETILSVLGRLKEIYIETHDYARRGKLFKDAFIEGDAAFNSLFQTAAEAGNRVLDIPLGESPFAEGSGFVLPSTEEPLQVSSLDRTHLKQLKKIGWNISNLNLFPDGDISREDAQAVVMARRVAVLHLLHIAAGLKRQPSPTASPLGVAVEVLPAGAGAGSVDDGAGVLPRGAGTAVVRSATQVAVVAQDSFVEQAPLEPLAEGEDGAGAPAGSTATLVATPVGEEGEMLAVPTAAVVVPVSPSLSLPEALSPTPGESEDDGVVVSPVNFRSDLPAEAVAGSTEALSPEERRGGFSPVATDSFAMPATPSSVGDSYSQYFGEDDGPLQSPPSSPKDVLLSAQSSSSTLGRGGLELTLEGRIQGSSLAAMAGKEVEDGSVDSSMSTEGGFAAAKPASSSVGYRAKSPVSGEF